MSMPTPCWGRGNTVCDELGPCDRHAPVWDLIERGSVRLAGLLGRTCMTSNAEGVASFNLTTARDHIQRALVTLIADRDV